MNEYLMQRTEKVEQYLQDATDSVRESYVMMDEDPGIYLMAHVREYVDIVGKMVAACGPITDSYIRISYGTYSVDELGKIDTSGLYGCDYYVPIKQGLPDWEKIERAMKGANLVVASVYIGNIRLWLRCTQSLLGFHERGPAYSYSLNIIAESEEMHYPEQGPQREPM